MVSQVNDSFLAKEMSMVAYLKLVIGFIPAFDNFEFAQISRSENAHAEPLSNLASCKDFEWLTIVLIECLLKHSATKGKEIMWVENTPPRLRPITVFLKDQSLSSDKDEAQKLRRRATNFILQDDVLCKRGFFFPLLRCISGEQATYMLQEIHEGYVATILEDGLLHKRC